MAIISSLAVGKSRKSAGNITYQHYYGKEVLKQKISKRGNAKATEKQISAQKKMSDTASCLKSFMPYINLAFTNLKGKTKFASIIKLNKLLFFDNTYPFSAKFPHEWNDDAAEFYRKYGYFPYMSYGINEMFTYDGFNIEVQSFSVIPRKIYKNVELVIFGDSREDNVVNLTRTPFVYDESTNTWNLKDFDVYAAMSTAGRLEHVGLWCILCDGKPITSREPCFYI